MVANLTNEEGTTNRESLTSTYASVIMTAFSIPATHDSNGNQAPHYALGLTLRPFALAWRRHPVRLTLHHR